MNVLVVHQNFPGQYVHAARWLVERGHNVVAIGQPRSGQVEGVRKIVYAAPAQTPNPNEFVAEFDRSIQNGLSVARLCRELKQSGFTPDLILGHNGWGEVLFVKDVWPAAPLLAYFEFYYRSSNSDLDFDPEFPPDPEIAENLRVRNAVNLLGLEAADQGQTATRWQRSLYPASVADRIEAIHEGVDVERVRPDPTARMLFRNGLSLGAQDQLITYCARNLEPYRGFHVFMRALPQVLSALPNARVLIAGGDNLSYGRAPRGAGNWRARMLGELGASLPSERVHFLGTLPFRQYLTVLQISSAHVYLTYPFVLSWSLIEAFSAGCLVIASRTAPVEEAATDGENARLVDFFDIEGLAARIVEAVRDPERSQELRQAAREFAVREFDAKTVCLPRHIAMWRRLTGDEALTTP